MELIQKMAIRFALALILALPILCYADVRDVTRVEQYDTGTALLKIPDQNMSAIDMKTRKTMFRGVRDLEGRVYRVETDDGKSLTVTFDVNGDPDEMRSSEGHSWKLKNKKMKKMRGAGSSIVLSKTAPIQAVNTVGPPNTDCMDNGFCTGEDFLAQCAADPTCFGFMEWISEAVGQLANSLQVGVTMGFLYGMLGAMYADGITWASMSMAEMTILGLEGSIWAGVAGGIVIWGYFNFKVGTFLYNQYGEIIWIKYGD